MKTSIDTRFFRAGVGTVIYNQAGQIALFERSQNPVGVWQFQQGGIDINEDLEDTLWRELKEEIGVTKDDVSAVAELPHWTIHTTDSALADASKSRLGQAHKWFFIKLQADTDIDLSNATEDESSDFRWTDFADAIAQTEPLKKHVYQELETYFEQHIRPTL